jgi:hypothetical protein
MPSLPTKGQPIAGILSVWAASGALLVNFQSSLKNDERENKRREEARASAKREVRKRLLDDVEEWTLSLQSYCAEYRADAEFGEITGNLIKLHRELSVLFYKSPVILIKAGEVDPGLKAHIGAVKQVLETDFVPSDPGTFNPFQKIGVLQQAAEFAENEIAILYSNL